MANELVWKNISSFWDLMNPDDKDHLGQVWEGAKTAIDDLYYSLYNTDSAKGLGTCPVYTTKRWLMLDLSQTNLDKVKADGDALLAKNKTTVDKNISYDSTIFNTKRSILHKHYCFKYNTNSGVSLKIPFPIDYTNLEIYSNGRQELALSNYLVKDNEIIFKGDTGVHYIYIALDHTPKVSDVFYKQNYVCRTDSADGIIDLGVNSNTDDYLVIVDGVLVNQSSVTTISQSQILCSVTGAKYEVYWFEPETDNTFTERHVHYNRQVIYNQDGQGRGTVSMVPIGNSIIQTCTDNAVEKILKVFQDGSLLDSSEYYVSGASIMFNSIRSYEIGQSLSFIVEWENITSTSEEKQHLHYAFQATNYQNVTTSSFFDDGDELDDGGQFDTEEEIPDIDFPFVIKEPNNLSIWVNGVRLYNTTDYVVGSRITFRVPIYGKNLKVYYYESSRIYSYGYTSIVYPNSKFAYVNLGLFYDETPEYIDKQVDADGQSLTFQQTTQILDGKTKLVGIPVITDAISNWTKMYLSQVGTETNAFEVSDGVILSDYELPEKSWCPAVFFDDNLLSTNFGYLVGYEADSTYKYKASLSNFYRTLWAGPTLKNIEWSISTFLGIPYSEESATVDKIEPVLLHRTIKTESESYDVPDTQLTVDDEVISGQYAESRRHTSDFFGPDTTMIDGVISHQNIGVSSTAGDTIIIENAGSFVITNVNDDNAVTLDGSPVFSLGLLVSSASTGPLSTVWDNSPAVTGFLPSTIFSVKPGDVMLTGGVEYTITGNIIQELTFESTVTLGTSYSIYSVNRFDIFSTSGTITFTNPGTVLSIDDAVGTRVSLTNGEYTIPPGVTTYLKTGDSVEPYQPLATVCQAIDYYVDNQWWFDKNSFFSIPQNTNTFKLAQSMQPYETTMYLTSTVGLADSGIVSIRLDSWSTITSGTFTISNTVTTAEKIKYSGISGNKLLNCMRAYSYQNDLQFSGTYPENTEVFNELEYNEKSLKHIAYEVYRSNTGGTEFTGIEKYFSIFATNVLLLKINNVASLDGQGLGLISNYMNRSMPSHIKWFLDIDTAYHENALVDPTQSVDINDIDSRFINYFNGRVVSSIKVGNIAAYIIGQQLSSSESNAMADVIDKDVSGSEVFISYYDDGSFSAGEVISVGAGSDTITSTEYKQHLLYELL